MRAGSRKMRKVKIKMRPFRAIIEGFILLLFFNLSELGLVGLGLLKMIDDAEAVSRESRDRARVTQNDR